MGHLSSGAVLTVSARWDTNNACVQLHFIPELRKKVLQKMQEFSSKYGDLSG